VEHAGIEEVLILALPYVSYPAIATALAAAAEVIKEHGLDVGRNTTLATAACFDTKRHPHWVSNDA
jgi:hypothetical protein